MARGAGPEGQKPPEWVGGSGKWSISTFESIPLLVGLGGVAPMTALDLEDAVESSTESSFDV